MNRRMSRKIKVLHLLNSGEYGGAQKVIISIMKSIASDIECAYASPDGYITEVLNREKITWIQLTGSSTKNLGRVIQEYSPDVVHAHDFTMSIRASFAVQNTPVISHLHHNPPWLRKICMKSIAYGISAKKYKKILLVSKPVLDEYVFAKCIEKKAFIVGNPIDTEEIIRLSKKESPGAKYDLVFVGRLHPAKNPLGFINVVKEAKKSIPSLYSAIIGDGELRREAELLIHQYGLDGCIEMKGFQENPYPILRNSKILCMPSKWEGFGLAAVEALALGVPVVCSAVGGLINIVDDSCGRLCTSEDAMSKNIVELISNNELLDRLHRGAIEKASAFHNIKEYVSEIESLYRGVLR